MKKGIIALLVVLIVSALVTFSGNNKLNSINVVSNSSNSGYKITLNTTEIAKIKRTIESDTRMVLELKNIKQSENISTSYKNARNIESVIVLPSSRNSLKVIIQGKNISNSTLGFDTEAKAALPMPPKVHVNSDSLMLENPIIWVKDNVRFDILMYISAIGLLILSSLNALQNKEKTLTIEQKERIISRQMMLSAEMHKMRATGKNQISRLQSMPIQRPSMNIKPSNVNSIRFLESMSKFYEKNGRQDLANEVKLNLRKAQLKQVV